MKCQVCPNPAVCHVTDSAGTQSFCSDHIPASLLEGRGSNLDLTATIYEQLRSQISYFEEHGNLPRLEFSNSPFSEDLFPSGLKDITEEAAVVNAMRAFADFIERNGRPPEDDELPDPFL